MEQQQINEEIENQNQENQVIRRVFDYENPYQNMINRIDLGLPADPQQEQPQQQLILQEPERRTLNDLEQRVQVLQNNSQNQTVLLEAVLEKVDIINGKVDKQLNLAETANKLLITQGQKLNAIHSDLSKGFADVKGLLAKPCNLQTWLSLLECIGRHIIVCLYTICLMFKFTINILLIFRNVFHIVSLFLFDLTTGFLRIFVWVIYVFETILFESVAYDLLICRIYNSEDGAKILLHKIEYISLEILTLITNYFPGLKEGYGFMKYIMIIILNEWKKFGYLSNINKGWKILIMTSTNLYRTVNLTLWRASMHVLGEELYPMTQEEVDAITDLEELVIKRLKHDVKIEQNNSEIKAVVNIENIDFEKLIDSSKTDAFFKELFVHYGGPQGKINASEFHKDDPFRKWIEAREKEKITGIKIPARKVTPMLNPSSNQRYFIPPPHAASSFRMLPSGVSGFLPGIRGGNHLVDKIVNLPKYRFEFLKKILNVDKIEEKHGGKKNTLKRRVKKLSTIRVESNNNRKLNKRTNKTTRKVRQIVGGNPSENFNNIIKSLGLDNISEKFKDIMDDDTKIIVKQKIKKMEGMVELSKKVFENFNYKDRELTTTEKTLYTIVFKIINSAVLTSFGLMGLFLKFTKKTLDILEKKINQKQQEELWEEVLQEQIKKK